LPEARTIHLAVAIDRLMVVAGMISGERRAIPQLSGGKSMPRLPHNGRHVEVRNMSDRRDFAHRIRSACLQAALEAYERAGVSGLCGEGRWELAVQAIRNLDLDPLLEADDEPASDFQ
jgi:hypothetical protein